MFFNQTVECDGSFVKMSSVDVKKMALKTLEWIKNEREKKREEEIQFTQKSLDNGFWHKLFRMKPSTREQAIAVLESDPWDIDYHCPEIIYWKNEDTAKRVLNACEHADEIYISTKDLRRIS